MQQRLGPRRPVAVGPDESTSCNTGDGAGRHPAARRTRPATATSTPPRNVLAYTAALTRAPASTSGSAAAFTGLRTAGGRVVGVRHPRRADRHRARSCSPAGPTLAAVGGRRARRIPAGRRPAPGRGHRSRIPTSTRTAADGLRRRRPESTGGPEERRPAVGDEQPRRAAGRGDRVRRAYYQKVRAPDRRAASRRPRGSACARTWAATIDYTPDHLPILGPLLTDDGPVDGHRGGQPPAATA